MVWMQAGMHDGRHDDVPDLDAQDIGARASISLATYCIWRGGASVSGLLVGLLLGLPVCWATAVWVAAGSGLLGGLPDCVFWSCGEGHRPV